MLKTKVFASIAALSLTFACAVGISACSGSSNGSSDNAVAATVNGIEISENEVTSTIQSIRENYGLTEEETWAQYLTSYGTTPEAIRQNMVDSYIEQIILEQGSESLGVNVDESEVNTIVENTRANYDSDKEWQTALERAGLTEDQYRKNIRSSLLQRAVQTHFIESAEVPAEDLDTYANMYKTAFTGAKRSSHILFAATDEATAQDVLARINSGELDFAEAAKTYSLDEGSASDGGDVGWDKMSNFITEYVTALSQLNKNEVSGLVTSSYGIHIIKCTDVYDADPDATVTIDQLPQEFQDAIRSMLKNSAGQNMYQAWLEEQRAAADIVVNDMPQDVPYNVDLSKYQTESASSSADATAASDSESSASAESAASE